MINDQKGLIVATSTTTDGNMSFRFSENSDVIANRSNFLNRIGLSYSSCVVMNSEHKDLISIVDDTTLMGPTTSAESVEADVLITTLPNISLLLTTADCIPLSFYHKASGLIGLAHLSRHTFTNDLIEKILYELENTFSLSPHTLEFVIGPHIAVHSYQFSLPLTNVHPKLEPFISYSTNLASINLTTAVVSTLIKQGVKQNQVQISETDTYTSATHFSHRSSVSKNDPQGRLATVICNKLEC